MKLLVAKGADINAKDYNGTTPLHEAAWSGHKDVVELLVDNGANVSAKDDESKVVGSKRAPGKALFGRSILP